MSETLIPTMNLRFVMRESQLPVYNESGVVIKTIPASRVLQQMFLRPDSDTSVWKDVEMAADNGREA